MKIIGRLQIQLEAQVLRQQRGEALVEALHDLFLVYCVVLLCLTVVGVVCLQLCYLFVCSVVILVAALHDLALSDGPQIKFMHVVVICC